MAEAGKPIEPIHQFNIYDIFKIGTFGGDGTAGSGVNIAFTNSALFMVLTVGAIGLFLIWGTSRRAIVPGRTQLLGEMVYEFVANMVRNTAGHDGMNEEAENVMPTSATEPGVHHPRRQAEQEENRCGIHEQLMLQHVRAEKEAFADLVQGRADGEVECHECAVEAPSVGAREGRAGREPRAQGSCHDSP